MKRFHNFAGACLSATLLAGCGGSTAAFAPTSAQQSQTTFRAQRTRTSSPCLSQPCVYVADSSRFGYKARILSYAEAANGDVAPLANITGKKTGLHFFGPGLAVDANYKVYTDNLSAKDVLVFGAGADGNKAPVQDISGSNTLFGDIYAVAVDSGSNIYVLNEGTSAGYEVLVFGAGANGNVAPIRNISGSNTGLVSPSALALDRSGNLYVTNSATVTGKGPTVTVYAAGANGNVSPIQTITGPNTLLDPVGIAVDSGLNIYVENDSSRSSKAGLISVFAAGASGNVSPIRTITGSMTKLVYPEGIALDSMGNIYVASDARSSTSILVFAAGANGNVEPIRTIKGSNTGMVKGPVWNLAVR